MTTDSPFKCLTMKRKLAKQMCAQWRSNVWLVVELMVVSVVLWYVNDYIFVRTAENLQDEGFDPAEVYLVKYRVGDVPDGADTDSLTVAWAGELGRRIASRPDVECWSLDEYSTPYFRSNYGTSLYDVADSTASLGFSASLRMSMRLGFVTPGYFSVLRIGGINGETPAQMDSLIAAGKVILSENVVYHEEPGARRGRPVAGELIGRRDAIDGVKRPVEAGALMKPQLRSTYESVRLSAQAYVPYGLFAFCSEPDLLVRLKEGASASKFIADLTGPESGMYSVGGLYLSGVQPLDAVRRASADEEGRTVNVHILAVIFLLLNVFLGLLGSFWFRTQRRTQEIAVRMVAGARRRQVIARMISEALLLLVIATVPALCIDFLAGRAELLSTWEGSNFSMMRLWIAGAITFVQMAVMVVTGTALPAWKAMRISPSTALQCE